MNALRAEVFEPVEDTAEDILGELRRKRERDFATRVEKLLPDLTYGTGPVCGLLHIGGRGVAAVYRVVGEDEDEESARTTKAWLSRPSIHAKSHIITLKARDVVIGDEGRVSEERGEVIEHASFWSSQYMSFPDAYKDYSEAQIHGLLNAIDRTIWHLEVAATDPLTYANRLVTA